MKSKVVQNLALTKYRQGDTSIEIYRHSDSGISLASVKTRCQMIRQSGPIHLLGTRAAPLVRALKRIYKNLKTICAENRRD